MGSLAKSSLTISALNGLTLGMGFASNMVVARVFGTSAQMDAFLAATALPQFLMNVINGSLSYTFIPVFAEKKKTSEKEAWSLVSTLINILALGGAFLVLLSMAFSGKMMKLLAPGFSPSQVGTSAMLLRWQLPVVWFSILNELMSSVYYSNGKFLRPLLFKAVSPVLTIGYVCLLSSRINIMSLTIAQFSSAVIQTIALAAGFLREKEFRYSGRIDFKTPGTMRIFGLMLPLLGGMCIYKIVPLLERWIASDLPVGGISVLGYAWKIMGVISPLVSAGITMSIFPEMARLKAQGDIAGLKRVMSRGIRTLVYLNMPIVFLLGVSGSDVVRLLFERGAFMHSDTIATASVLGLYLLALPAGAIGSIIGQGYYVFQDTRTPVLMGIAEVAFYLIAASILVPRFGLTAIPFSYAAYMNFSLINGWFVRAKLGNRGGAGILRSAMLHGSLSAVVSGGVYAINLEISGQLARNAIIISGLAAYFLVGRFLIKSEEALLVWNKVIAPAWKRFTFAVV